MIEERKMGERIGLMGNEVVWTAGYVVEQMSGPDLEKPW